MFVIIFWVLIMVIIIFLFLFLMSWRNVKNTEGKMIAEIWEPSGYPVRHLVKIEETGKTVEVGEITYCLSKEHGPEELKTQTHTYPSRRYVLYPTKPFLGLKFLQVTLRIESWEKNNPEPIRPFYGRVDPKDGKFISGQLTVTGAEWSAQKREIQATTLAMSIQENEARQKEFMKVINNQPSKMIIYLGLGVCAIASIASAIMIFQVVGVVGG